MFLCIFSIHLQSFVCKQLCHQVKQVFLSNTNNLYIVICFQAFLSNIDNLYTVIWYQVFLSNTNNLHTVI